jgi:hypothetical protein
MKKNQLGLCAIILSLSVTLQGMGSAERQATIKIELRKPNPDFEKIEALIQGMQPGSNRTFYQNEMAKRQAILRTAPQQPTEPKPEEQRIAEEQRVIVQESIKKEEEPERKEARTEFNTLLDAFEQTVAQQEQLVSQSADPDVFYTARFDTIPVASVQVQKAREKDLEDPTRIQARQEDIDRWVSISQRGNNLRWKLLDRARKAVNDLTAYVAQHQNLDRDNDQQFKTLNAQASQELQNLYTKIITKIANNLSAYAGQAPIELFEVLLAINDPENNQPGKLANAYSAANDGLPFPEPDITAAVLKINQQQPNGLEYLRAKVAELKQKNRAEIKAQPKKKKIVTFKNEPEIKTFKKNEPIVQAKPVPVETKIKKQLGIPGGIGGAKDRQ